VAVVDLQNHDRLEELKRRDFKNLTLDYLLKTNRNFYYDLIHNYQPLLAEIGESEAEPTIQDKENIKKMFMESTIGSLKTDKLKLSDFIDEAFFDDNPGASPPVRIMNDALIDYNKPTV
jgi:hypothetical protein